MAEKKAYKNKKNNAGPFFWTDDQYKRMQDKYPGAFYRVPMSEAHEIEKNQENAEVKRRKELNELLVPDLKLLAGTLDIQADNLNKEDIINEILNAEQSA